MKPGIYTAMPAAEYHALPHLSSGLAKLLIEQSPLHAWTASQALNPNFRRVEKEEFDIGSAAHALLLEGQDRMVVVEADDWRKAAAREARDAARAEGKHPILARRYQDVMKMRDVAVRAIADCADLGGLSLGNGAAEVVLLWEDVDGVSCRARLDFLPLTSPGGRVVLDYKSTTDATPRAFSRQISRMGYHYQGEFYSRGVERALGVRPKFIFLAQETAPPYACSFHGCGASLAAIAREDVRQAIRTWGACMKANRWPAHDQHVIHWAEATPWQLTEAEERIGIPYDVEKLFERRVVNEDAAVWP